MEADVSINVEGLTADNCSRKIAKGNKGYNAATSKYGDMLEMGIIDPTKVTCRALQAAGMM